MEVLGIGIDLVSVSRVQRILARWDRRFLDRVFTPREQDDAKGALGVRRLAGRLAIKEATLKALGTGLREGRWVHLEVTNDPLGKPMVHLKEALAGKAKAIGVDSFLVSLSYEQDLAVAQVMAIRR